MSLKDTVYWYGRGACGLELTPPQKRNMKRAAHRLERHAEKAVIQEDLEVNASSKQVHDEMLESLYGDWNEEQEKQYLDGLLQDIQDEDDLLTRADVRSALERMEERDEELDYQYDYDDLGY